ncbi:RHS domain-containing protein [Stenotrophomonas sp. DR822]|uniref:RHS repeat domain-containing protein n=1 Tax=Stenotrophomonas sp. DR822 TaxID=2871174 RepID=UPI001C9454AF|nr:RHS repeat-associated core domain-containing protein [Stenotrophomonas sp. DR822]QZN82242.1 RHS domain-containing protein [Stenotrophomonas sp. DR822]
MNGITSLLIRAALLVVTTLAGATPAAAQEVVEYIHTDALGSPVAITDASGNVIERTVYEPYGAVVNRPLKDGPGYTGHVTDSGTGLSYMQQRYYDQSMGIFFGVDPVSALADPVAAFGRYKYTSNNPYRYIDPDGRSEKVTGSQIRGGRGFAGARLAILRTSVRSPLDNKDEAGVNQKISGKVEGAGGRERRGSEARSAIKLVGVVDAIKARLAADEAMESARKSGLSGMSHGRGDAMRHCTWSCQMARDIGEENARLIGDNHELWGADSPGGRQMDLNNNAIGRDLSSMSGACSANCLEAAKNDALEVYYGK